VRVALIIAGGKLRPVWFEEADRPGRDRVFVSSVNYIGEHQKGSARFIDFAVTGADAGCYELKLNTSAFTWELWVTETN
jgi:hypothetical protein